MSLASRTVRGAAWGVAAGFGSRLVGLAATLLLTRFLAPAEYGEVAIATIVVMTVYQFSTLAVGVYLTAHPDCGRDVVFHATVLHVGLGIVALVVSLAVGFFGGPLLESPNLSRYVPLLAISFFVDRVASMPERMLLRRLAFSRVSGTRGVGEVAYAATAIACAMSGLGGMSIVFGNVVRASVRAVSFSLSTSFREWLTPSKLELATLALLARHGFWVSVAGLFDLASRKWDNIVVGKLFGPAVAGTYNLAYNLAELPALQVGEPINDVLQVSYAHAGAGGREQALRRSIAILALVMGPFALGLAAIADSLTRALFPAAWSGLGPMMMVLALLSFLRPLEGAVSSYLFARSMPRDVAIVDGLGLVILLAVLWTAGRASPTVACASVVFAVFLRGAIYSFALRAREGIASRVVIGAVLPPLVAAVAMAVPVYFVPRFIEARPIVLVVAQVALGAVLYPLFAMLIARHATRDFAGLVRTAIARKRPKAAETPPPPQSEV